MCKENTLLPIYHFSLEMAILKVKNSQQLTIRIEKLNQNKKCFWILTRYDILTLILHGVICLHYEKLSYFTMIMDMMLCICIVDLKGGRWM